MPNSEFINALDDIGAAAAAIVTAITLTVLFFRFYATQRAAERKQFDEHRAADRLLIENHMSGSIRALGDVTRALQQVNDNLAELRADVRSKQ